MWILLIGSALNSFGVFAAFPLFSLYALDYFKLSAIEIGVISGIWPMTLFCATLFCGMIADRYGCLKTLRWGIFINATACLLMAVSQNLAQFCVALFLFGLGKAFSDNSVRVALLRLAKDDELERVFRIRYLLQNVGAMLGPLVGIVAYEMIFGKSFLLSAIAFLIFCIITFIGLRNNSFKNDHIAENPSILKSFSVLRDINLQLWIVSGMCIWITYGSYEGLMPVVVSESYGVRPNFGFLVSLNAVVVIIFQLGHLRLFKNPDMKKSVNFGFILMAMGFACFAINWQPFIMTLLATVIFSIGEAVLFPCFDVTMADIAPSKQRALYYGAGELKQIGFFLGPVLGGVLLQYGGSIILFVGCTVSIVIAKVLFNKMQRIETTS